MKMKIYRDAAGNVINIGDWDFRIVRQPVTDEHGGEIMDTREDGGYVVRTQQVMLNPLPDGAYEDEAEVEIMPDGGLRVVE